jgi:CBS domain-containing protein
MNRTISTWVRRVVDENGDTVDQPTTYAPSRNATVATIMTRMTYCVRPDVSVETLAALLLDHRVSGVPVVNPQGQPVGVVSKTDLLRHLHERGDVTEPEENLDSGFHVTRVDPTTVKDIMMPVVFAIEQDMPIVEASALMAGEGVHRLAVVDADLAIIGIVSSLDIVRWVAEQAGYAV